MSAFAPKATELLRRRELQRWANSDIADPYSITLSARANNASGTAIPIALAVLRLITSSNLVGCSTGMSAILMPRNAWAICGPTVDRLP